jgi:GNAT superfamily N-acetyltransferase
MATLMKVHISRKLCGSFLSIFTFAQNKLWKPIIYPMFIYENYTMQFETITYKDLDEIRNLQPDGWPDIIPDFEFYIRSPFCHAVKAKMSDRIVGTGAFILHEKTSWIAHIIVDTNHRNQGIGRKIVDYLLENFFAKSAETCLLIATELGKPVYVKSGFREVTEYYFFKRHTDGNTYPVSERICACKKEHHTDIFALDNKISGENRKSLLKDYLDNSMVYVENNQVLGCYIPDLKEGLIIADTTEAGLQLMKIKYSKIHKAVLPSDNMEGINFLKQNGFTKMERVGTRMLLGKDIPWIPQKLYSRIGGNLG